MGLGNISDYMDENWHGGQIEGDFFDHPEMQIEENLKVDKKPAKSVWNWKYAISRDLMRGYHTAYILSKYENVIKRFDLFNKVNAFLNKYDGVLGYFIVDVSKFDDKFTYNDIPDFMRRCNLYAIGSTELREIINRSLVSQNDGSMDGFLGADEDNIDEEISYVDEITGLPCIDSWNGESDDDDERLFDIVKLFLGRKIMTIAEKQKFNKIEGKLPYLISILKKSFMPKSNANNKFQDDINDYNVKQHELQADSQKSVKDAEVTNLKEEKLDDLGNDVLMPDKYDIKKEYKKSDFKQDVNLNKPVKDAEVNNLKEEKLDDIGNVNLLDKVSIENKYKKSDYVHDFDVKDLEKVQIKNQHKKSDFKQDVNYDNVKKDFIINDIKDMQDQDFQISDLEEVLIQDQHKDSDYNEDITFDNTEEFVIDDIKDMKDDEFDYADLSQGNVDIDEMFGEEADTNDVQIQKVPEKVEISNKYDWSW